MYISLHGKHDRSGGEMKKKEEKGKKETVKCVNDKIKSHAAENHTNHQPTHPSKSAEELAKMDIAPPTSAAVLLLKLQFLPPTN